MTLHSPPTMIPPDLAGEPDARDRRWRDRVPDDKRILVHWIDENGNVARSTREALPRNLLIGIEGLNEAEEVWWHPDGSVSPWPPRVKKRGDNPLGDNRPAGDPQTD